MTSSYVKKIINTGLPYLKRVEINCPCGNTFEAIIYSIANVTIRHWLKDEILNEEFNCFNCSKCGQKFCNMYWPLLYHDMERRFMIWFYSEENIEESKKHYKRTKKLISTLPSYSEEARKDEEILRKKKYICEVAFGFKDFKKKLIKLEKKRPVVEKYKGRSFIDPLYVHSLNEVNLYILIQACKKCKKNSLKIENEERQEFKKEIYKLYICPFLYKVTTKCSNCGNKTTFYFNIKPCLVNPAYAKNKNLINISKNPSRSLDLVDYTNLALRLFDKLRGKLKRKDHQGIEFLAEISKGCLAEALKFYNESKYLDEDIIDLGIFSDKNKEIYKRNLENFSYKYLKFQEDRINTFCNNLEDMKEI